MWCYQSISLITIIILETICHIPVKMKYILHVISKSQLIFNRFVLILSKLKVIYVVSMKLLTCLFKRKMLILLLSKMSSHQMLSLLDESVSIHQSTLYFSTLIFHSWIILVSSLTCTLFIFTFIVFRPVPLPVLVLLTYILRVTFLSEMPNSLIIFCSLLLIKAINLI